jgi:hypothetical protein
MIARLIAMGDALSQFVQVTCCPHRDRPPNANESLSGRSHREGWWTEHAINALFFWQRNPGHCERSDHKDYERALAKVRDYERRNGTRGFIP